MCELIINQKGKSLKMHTITLASCACCASRVTTTTRITIAPAKVVFNVAHRWFTKCSFLKGFSISTSSTADLAGITISDSWDTTYKIAFERRIDCSIVNKTVPFTIPESSTSWLPLGLSLKGRMLMLIPMRRSFVRVAPFDYLHAQEAWRLLLQLRCRASFPQIEGGSSVL